MESKYNLKSPAVKRLMKEAAELRDPTEHYHAQPLEDNLFEWHFSVRGPPDSDFDGGVYHGRIILPPEYPMKPPSIILLTPNGRFEVGKKICLSISGHHPETWQPSWSIRTALIAIIGFMPTKGEGAIGSLDYTPEERRALAKKSQDFCCETCGCTMRSALLDLTPNSNPGAEDHTAKELAQQINFKAESSYPENLVRMKEEKVNLQPTPRDPPLQAKKLKKTRPNR
uniref:ubiquitin-conjugating enzyme E2 J1 n=1 Tax=Maylandia zebra TaxID=106582 RepID=UPI000D31EB47|nr:ubiquitin-conjugating enzyme E2 J1-like [Maylandia zebra]